MNKQTDKRASRTLQPQRDLGCIPCARERHRDYLYWFSARTALKKVAALGYYQYVAYVCELSCIRMQAASGLMSPLSKPELLVFLLMRLE
jgi:hypothetical protein